jgi:mono/diheme cytochrome c family protein
MKRTFIAVFIAFVLAAATNAAATPPSKRKSDEERGQELYERSCWMCHGRSGAGDGPASASLEGGIPSLEERIDVDKLAPSVKLVQEGRGRMPGFADSIDERDTRRVLKYARSLTLGGPAMPLPPDAQPASDADGQDAPPEAGGE